jgi:hypothetical protein
VQYAAAELGSLKVLNLDAPSISPSGDGRLLAVWTGAGIEIELWFKGPYDEVLLVDDERGELAYIGSDPRLSRTVDALLEMQRRG